MKDAHILFAIRQAGTSHAFLPVLEGLHKRRIPFLISAFKDAAKVLDTTTFAYSRIKNCNDIDLEQKPTLIVTGTSECVFDDNRLWAFAQKSQIPCLAFVDSWVNYAARFKITEPWDALPTSIAVIDQQMYNGMISYGCPKALLVITGSPAFDYLVHERQITSSKPGNKPTKLLIIMDPILDIYGDSAISTIGYDEFTFLNSTFAFLIKMKLEWEIEIRIHPRETEDKYIEYLNMLSSNKVFITDYKKKKLDSLKEADLVIGMNSILLYEATIFGLPVFSYQVNARDIPDVINNSSRIEIISNVDEFEKTLSFNRIDSKQFMTKSKLSNTILSYL